MKLSELKKLKEPAHWTVERMTKADSCDYLFIDIVFTNLRYTCTNNDGEQLSECPIKLPSIARVETYVNKKNYVDEQDFLDDVCVVLIKNLSFMTREFSVNLKEYNYQFNKEPIPVSKYKEWSISCNVDLTKEIEEYFNKNK